MTDDAMKPPPKRSERAKTDLKGSEIALALKAMGVSPGRFCRLTGVNESRFKRQPKDKDTDDLPLFYEIVLFALYHHPELRTTKDPIDLPFEEWGIAIEIEET